MKDKRIDLLSNAKVSTAVNQMALPAIVGFLVMAIYNVVDSMFVAWLGTEATSATQVVFPINMLASALGLAFGIGGASFVSRLMGMKQTEKANQVASVSLFTALGAGILFTICTIVFVEPVLRFFGADDSIMYMSKGYGTYILAGSMFIMGNMTMNNLLRSEGSAKLSMIGMAVGSVLNMILDPLFIFVFDMGIEGAAIATTISQMVTFIILLSHYFRGATVIKIGPSHYKPSLDMAGQIGKIGIPTFFRQLLFSVSLAYLNQKAMALAGANLLAAVGLISRVTMIPIYFIFGIGQGLQPVVGFNFGSGDGKRVEEAFAYTVKVSLGVSAVAAILVVLLDTQILSIFRAEPEVVGYAVQGIKFAALAMVMMSVSNTIGIFYQSIGRGVESLLLSIARQGLFFLPTVFILPGLLGTTGILSAQLLADTLTLILSGVMFLTYRSGNKLALDIVSQ